MNELILMCGPSASGKSTYIKEHLNNAYVVSRDKIRFSLLKNGEDYFAHEGEVLKKFYKEIKEVCLNQKIKTVVVDATNLTPRVRRKVLRLSAGRKKIAFGFSIDYNTLLEHNKNREGRAAVPESAILQQVKAYKFPTMEEGFDIVYQVAEVN